MSDTLPSLLSGHWVHSSGETAHVSKASVDVRSALQYARERGGPVLRAMTFAVRGRLLANIAARLGARRDASNRTLLVNMGAPARDAAMDVEGAIQTLQY